MSDDLYSRRILWEGLRRTGIAKIDEVRVVLSRCPPFLLEAVDLWFAPEIRQTEVRETAVHPRRDMTVTEIADANHWLERIRDAVRGHT